MICEDHNGEGVRWASPPVGSSEASVARGSSHPCSVFQDICEIRWSNSAFSLKACLKHAHPSEGAKVGGKLLHNPQKQEAKLYLENLCSSFF